MAPAVFERERNEFDSSSFFFSFCLFFRFNFGGCLRVRDMSLAHLLGLDGECDFQFSLVT
jgi:hypothetical protein